MNPERMGLETQPEKILTEGQRERLLEFTHHVGQPDLETGELVIKLIGSPDEAQPDPKVLDLLDNFEQVNLGEAVDCRFEDPPESKIVVKFNKQALEYLRSK